MTIRLSRNVRRLEIDDVMALAQEYVIRSGEGVSLAYANTEAEAEQAKRAFEQVLAPRFTRDEAIAIATERIARDSTSMDLALGSERRRGARLALEALAAAGVFSGDDDADPDARTMSHKLDAAGIR